MNKKLNTKKELIQEIARLKRRITRLEKSAVRTDKAVSVHELDDKSRYIFENVNDAMIYLDKKGFIVEANKEIVRIFGVLREELIGRHFTKIGIFYPKDIPGLLSSFETVLSGKHANLNLQIKNKKQEIFFIECSASPMKTRGKTAGMIVIMRDVTERQNAENLLNIQRDLAMDMSIAQNLNEGLRSCLDAAITASGMDCGGMYLVDDTSGVLDMVFYKGLSPDFIKSALHYDANSPSTQLVMKGKPVYKQHQDLGVPLDETRLKEQLRAIAVIPILHNQKVIGCLNISSHSLDEVPAFARGALETIAAQIGSAIARLKAEKSYRESEERYGKILATSPDAIMLYDAKSREILDANGAAVKLYGYGREEFLKIKYTDITAEIEASDNSIKELLSEKIKKIPLRYHKKKDGTIFPVEISGSVFKLKGGNVICGIIRDITERKQAEEALRESESRFRQFFENEPVYCYIISTDGKILDINSLALEVLGYRKKEIVGKSFLTTVYAPSSQEKAKELFMKWKVMGELKNEELNIITKSGEERTVLLSVDAIKNADGEILHSISVQRDITERKRAEEALRESEERYRKLVENATEGILVAQDRSIKFANPRIEEITSFTREELLSKPFLEFIHPDDREYVIDNQMKRLKGKSIPETYEIRMINKYGETRWLKIGGVIIAWEGGPASLNFVVDITETKRLRELESRAQRLETAGQIAGQVAHDFNNLLAPLIAYPEFIRRVLSKNHAALPFLKDMEKAAHKIADINQQLLTLGRRGHYNLVPLNLNDVICETLNELISLPETLIIDTELAGDLLNIKAGRAQIHRMISNMINNARDATQDIGRIVLKTENFYADNIAVAYGRVPRGEYVKLKISDTGHGISEDIIQKIFDPFFTTKTADKRRGSGLGLSVVDSVIKDHYGFLDLCSKVGEGTSFFFYFPITRENIDDQVSEHITGGDESVLVVDDDDVQRKVSSKILMSLGYRATTVESGEKAVELLRKKPHDLLFLDMIMTPGIDGTETLRQALGINPAQKAIIVSGFAESKRVQEALELGAGAFIRKPITLKKMAAAVRKELDRKEEVRVH